MIKNVLSFRLMHLNVFTTYGSYSVFSIINPLRELKNEGIEWLFCIVITNFAKREYKIGTRNQVWQTFLYK